LTPSFSAEDRDRIVQRLKDFRKKIPDSTEDTLGNKFIHSLLGDLELVHDFESKWLANEPGGERLEPILARNLARTASLLLGARPKLDPKQLSDLAAKLLSIREAIPVPLAAEAHAIRTV
jgi:hypothetical protein